MVKANSTQRLPLELKDEISSSETLRVEFKESYADTMKIQHTMISFANAVGGRIYIGVKEISSKSGLHTGKIIGVTKPERSQASNNVRQWAESFRPKIDVSFSSFQEEGRVDVIEVKESNQKPVCSSGGLYKIRSSDGNTGIDPALIRQMVVGLESFKTALVVECVNDLDLLDTIYEYASATPPKALLSELSYSTMDAILTNGTLSSFFDINMLTQIRRQCVEVNKLLDFAITAGGIIIEAKEFYDKILEICPALKSNIWSLIHELNPKVP